MKGAKNYKLFCYQLMEATLEQKTKINDIRRVHSTKVLLGNPNYWYSQNIVMM